MTYSEVVVAALCAEESFNAVVTGFARSGMPVEALSRMKSTFTNDANGRLVINEDRVVNSPVLGQALLSLIDAKLLVFSLRVEGVECELQICDQSIVRNKNILFEFFSKCVFSEIEHEIDVDYVLVKAGACFTFRDIRSCFIVTCSDFDFGVSVLHLLLKTFKPDACDKSTEVASVVLDSIILSKSTFQKIPVGGGKKFGVPEADPANVFSSAATDVNFSLSKSVDVLNEIPFLRVLRQRKSTNEFGNRALTSLRFGQLMVASLVEKEDNDRPKSDLHAGKHLYPSGGGVYEHDVLVTQFSPSDVPMGVYLYDKSEHRLQKLDDNYTQVDKQFQSLSQISMTNSFTSCITIFGNYGRLDKHYSEITGSLILKNSGVIIASIYNAASLIGADVCCLGLSVSPLSDNFPTDTVFPISSILLSDRSV